MLKTLRKFVYLKDSSKVLYSILHLIRTLDNSNFYYVEPKFYSPWTFQVKMKFRIIRTFSNCFNRSLWGRVKRSILLFLWGNTDTLNNRSQIWLFYTFHSSNRWLRRCWLFWKQSLFGQLRSWLVINISVGWSDRSTYFVCPGVYNDLYWTAPLQYTNPRDTKQCVQHETEWVTCRKKYILSAK